MPDFARSGRTTAICSRQRAYLVCAGAPLSDLLAGMGKLRKRPPIERVPSILHDRVGVMRADRRARRPIEFRSRLPKGESSSVFPAGDRDGRDPTPIPRLPCDLLEGLNETTWWCCGTYWPRRVSHRARTPRSTRPHRVLCLTQYRCSEDARSCAKKKVMLARHQRSSP
jgi:hypothetical protein